jgi:hypothetical protein
MKTSDEAADEDDFDRGYNDNSRSGRILRGSMGLLDRRKCFTG